MNLEKELFCRQDSAYRGMMVTLLPVIPEERIIGVRTPFLRKMIRDFTAEEKRKLMCDLPHRWFEENQLHAFLISEERSFAECIRLTEEFLPFVDNWATCDQLRPRCFSDHRKELLSYAEKWIHSGETYTIRFGIGMFMKYYLKDLFSEEYIWQIAEIVSSEYYVNMMRAWYFAEALVWQYDSMLPYFEMYRLDEWTYLKAIQKACDSRRISSDRKTYLKSLRRTRDCFFESQCGSASEFQV